MEPSTKKESKILEDLDANCRLRNCLNVLSLAHIFQYVDTQDLYTLGGMNEYYKQIINDYVISNHIINFHDCISPQNGDTMSELFRRHGTKFRRIRNIQFTPPVIQLIVQYCSIGQVKSVESRSVHLDRQIVGLPIQFRDVERFQLQGFAYNGYPLSVNFSRNLVYLNLTNVNLQPDFDWTELANLTELHLDTVKQIYILNFIEFIRVQQKLQRFYQRNSLYDYTQVVYDAMAEYCGNQIEVLHDRNNSMEIDENSYRFLSRLKHLKEVGFLYNYNCSRNLIYAIQCLAETDTIERLVIHTNPYPFCECPLTTEAKMFVEQFTKLKTIRIHSFFGMENVYDRIACDRMKLLVRYAEEILWNVETVEIILESKFRDWELLKYVPRLRQLYIVLGGLSKGDESPESEEAADIISHVKDILRTRAIDGAHDDVIEIKVDKKCLDVFSEIDDIGHSIKLILIPNFSIK